ncbi:ABC transporter substrate-binding protein [Klebsiella pneumoniae]|nr:ABC transporter substrate-binding protein [Klebsiella pneumoniae]
MRLLHRLNQYQRLWQPSAGAPQQVTVGELAERCFCSERHVRTLLRQAQEAGWLSWQASSGRGKRGQLSFHKTPESLRNEMMEQALNNGQQQNALELAQLAPVELKALLHPFLGGQWQNNTPTLRIPYYRPLEPLRPGFLPGRAEQHLAGQIYAGLTRFDEGDNMPDRRSGAPLAGLPGRPALAFLYPLHAVLAQWRYGGNRAVATAVTAAA